MCHSSRVGVERVVQCIRRSLAGSAPQDLTVINDDVYVYVRDDGRRKGLLFHRLSQKDSLSLFSSSGPAICPTH